MHPAERRRRILVVAAVAASLLAVAVIVGSIVVIQRVKDSTPPVHSAPPMSDYVPPTITGVADVAYGTAPRERLDVWYPSTTAKGKVLPTIVWLHGGGWATGDKSVITPYLKILADRGFTTVGVDYSYAPGKRYPTQVRQLNAALGHLAEHAEELHVDSSRFILAGDSAGAQISAQVAALTADPALARELKITPSLRLDQISGVLLASGIFDLDKATRVSRSVRGYIDGYLGTTTDRARLERASITNHVTQDFPPTWVTGGNVDPLTKDAKVFARRLQDLGVVVRTKFYPDDHEPRLIHEYQFDLSSADAQAALDSAVRFAKDVTG